MRKTRLYLSPYYIFKSYLLRDLRLVLAKYPFTGTVLDIGCGQKPYKAIFRNIKEYKGIDFNSYSINKDFPGEKPDYYFSEDYLTSLRLPFPNESFENIVAFQVLEHHKSPQKLIDEMFRITKKKGYILITVPFIGGIHEAPHDYYRYTQYGLEELFKSYNHDILETLRQGSIFSTISILLNEYLDAFASRSRSRYVISLLIYPIFLLFQYLSFILDKIFKSNKIFINYLILVRKNG